MATSAGSIGSVPSATKRSLNQKEALLGYESRKRRRSPSEHRSFNIEKKKEKDMNNQTKASITLSDDERQPCEVWTRVMGYHRPVSQFNPGKKSEHTERQHFAECRVPCPEKHPDRSSNEAA